MALLALIKIADALTDTGLVPTSRLLFTNADLNWRLQQPLSRFEYRNTVESRCYRTEGTWQRSGFSGSAA
jgi:hypothetical protein